jgi:hypothetical protein
MACLAMERWIIAYYLSFLFIFSTRKDPTSKVARLSPKGVPRHLDKLYSIVQGKSSVASHRATGSWANQ